MKISKQIPHIHITTMLSGRNKAEFKRTECASIFDAADEWNGRFHDLMLEHAEWIFLEALSEFLSSKLDDEKE